MRENCYAVGLVEAVYARMVQRPALEVESLYPWRARVREEKVDVLGDV